MRRSMWYIILQNGLEWQQILYFSSQKALLRRLWLIANEWSTRKYVKNQPTSHYRPGLYKVCVI